MDTAALASTMEGLENGHYAALPTPGAKIAFGLPLGHCEGDDHLKRLDLLLELREEIAGASAARAITDIQVFGEASG